VTSSVTAPALAVLWSVRMDIMPPDMPGPIIIIPIRPCPVPGPIIRPCPIVGPTINMGPII
jgi:hypothetical protein